jgi:hypothetical protein
VDEVNLGASWNNRVLSRGAITAFLEGLPAIERASLDVAFALLYGQSLSAYINGYIQTNVTFDGQGINNALATGDRKVLGDAPIPASWSGALAMSLGLIAGITQGVVAPVVNLSTLVYSLTTNYDQTTTAVIDSMASTLVLLQNEQYLAVAEQFLPNVFTVYKLWQKDQLQSYQGGEAVGVAISEVVQAAIINGVGFALGAETGGTSTFLGLVFRIRYGIFRRFDLAVLRLDSGFNDKRPLHQTGGPHEQCTRNADATATFVAGRPAADPPAPRQPRPRQR